VSGSGLGRRQHATLEAMWRNGGIWPQQWRISYAQQRILDSLCERGQITSSDGGTYRLAVTR
jgi:hypothetical protein